MRFNNFTVCLIFLACLICIYPGGNSYALSEPGHGFIENKGQIIDQNNKPNPAVLYLLNTPGLNVQLRRDGFSYDVYSVSSRQIINRSKQDSVNCSSKTVNYHRIDIDLEGTNFDYEIIPSCSTADYLNYYTTGTTVNGATLVHSYASITYKNIYDNIDIEFIADNAHQYKYNFIVHPGGKTSAIRIKISGATEIVKADEGLLLRTNIADVEEKIPYAYFLVNGFKTEVRSIFRKIDKTHYGITVNRQIPGNATLIIDPVPRRLWGTYYGGDTGNPTDNDVTRSCTLDKDGNLIIAGYTAAINNIATIGSYQSTNNGMEDTYLAKFTPDGIRIWGTYYGGANLDWSMECVTDNDKNIFLTGRTASTSNIATEGSYQPALDSAIDAFIVKFNSNGFRIWGTYYGGNLYDCGNSIALDPQCNIFLAGETESANNMASSDAFQASFGGGESDAFLAKFDSTGQRMWGTYYGGQEFDYGYHCSVDLNGHILFSGNTASTNNIASPGAHQTTFGGNGGNQGDAFLVLFDQAGQRQWGTYYGGTGGEGGMWCYTTTTGKRYLSGATFSPDNISTPGSYQPEHAGLVDAFIAKFNLNGVREWGTYYGASRNDQVWGADYDQRGALFICGLTWSTNNLASPDAYQTNFGGIYDAFLAKFDTNGIRMWCTYYGGTGADYGWACVTDTNDRQYLVGHTTSVTGISTPGSHQDYHAGGFWDGYIAKLTDCTNPVPGPITGPSDICLNSSGIIYSIPAIQKVTDYIWSVPPGATITAGQNTPVITVDFSGSTTPGEISIYAINHCGIGDTAILEIKPHPRPFPVITGNDSICLGISAVYKTQKEMTNYQWDVSPGGTIISGGTMNDSTVTILWTSVGPLWIKVNYMDSIGCTALIPAQFDVLVYPGTALTNDPLSKSICSGDSTRILLTATQPGTTFTWTATGSSMYVSGYDGGFGDTINQKLLNTGSNPETVTYSITPEINGCLGLTEDYIVTVNPILPVSVSVDVSANFICAGTLVTYTATPVNGGSTPQYQWQVNGTNVGLNSPVYSYTPNNGDIVICVLTSNVLCPAGNPATSNAVTMTVNPNLQVSVSISANPSGATCEGTPVTYTAVPVNGGTLPQYQWKVNGINVGSNDPVYTYSPVSGDQVSCVLTSSEICTTNNPATSNLLTMQVFHAPVVTFNSCFDTITTINASPFKLKGGLPLGGIYSGPGVNSSTGVFNPSIAGTGTKTIAYSYTNVYLCIASSVKTITVQSSPPFTCGNNLTDIRDGKVYRTIQVGSKCWMGANLNYGSWIHSSTHQIDNCIPEKYCPNDLQANCQLGTAAYQWDELIQYGITAAPDYQGVCPPGWHIPSAADFQELIDAYQGSSRAGTFLTDLYLIPRGFEALLQGMAYLNTAWAFTSSDNPKGTLFWTSTPGSNNKIITRGVNNRNQSVSLYESSKANSLPVRCVKD